ncbi:MAG TPA: spore cortex biosynthesis protein YabQ [Pseudogracilibacillus sp.]|nr:spore cortex biosynthesis protein YabQ [Pseudogracilibacillus sp.]
MTLHTQFLTMGAMIVGGMYLGFTNETFRRFTPVWKRSVFLTYSLEILFWLLQTSVLYYALYTINYGEIRFYLFIALAFGFMLYIALFQTIYIKVLDFVIKVVKKVLITLYKMCMMPILFIVRLLLKLFSFILNIVIKIGRFLLYRMLLPVIKWILPEKVYNFISKMGALCSTMVNTLYNKLRSFFRK